MKSVKKLILSLFLFAMIVSPFNVKAEESVNISLIIKSNAFEKTEKLIQSLGIRSYEKIEQLSSFVASFEAQNDYIRKKISESPSTIFIEENKKTTIADLPNDPYLQYQAYLTNSNIISAWSTITNNPSTTIAVIDTGVNYLHEDLRNKMWRNTRGEYGYDFVNNDSDPMDDNLHGTMVAGIIAAETNNGVGIAGATNSNVRIMAVKAVPASGEGNVSDLIKALIYASDNGARIVNVSLGLTEESTALNEAVSYALNRNTLVVAATGNKSTGVVDNPARNPSVIGVGAIDEFGNRASYASYGNGISMTALGNNIFSTSISRNNFYTFYQNGNGTSFSAPQVTASAALLLAKDPSLTPLQIKKRLLSSATKLPGMGGSDYSIYFGYGKLNAYGALTYDTMMPEINVNLHKSSSGGYILIGSISDDKTSTNILPNISNSNIAQVRYQVGNSGSWVNITNAPAQLVNVSQGINNPSAGNYNVILEVTDTSGNMRSVVFNTANALPPPSSSNLADYRFEFISQSSYVNIAPGQKMNMSISFRNTGNTTWTKDKVRLATSRNRDRSSLFADNSWLSTNRIGMQEDYVMPGEIANFLFTVTAPPNANGAFNEYFGLVVEGLGWLPDIGIYWKINTSSSEYSAAYVGQSPYITINGGEESLLWVEYKNTGNTTWNFNNVRLGSSNPLDRASSFYNYNPGSGWLANNRITMSKQSVPPGETVRFNFLIYAQRNPGVYREHFRPVVDGVKWMEDYGVFWQITVK